VPSKAREPPTHQHAWVTIKRRRALTVLAVPATLLALPAAANAVRQQANFAVALASCVVDVSGRGETLVSGVRRRE
jgi:hypothetical protein